MEGQTVAAAVTRVWRKPAAKLAAVLGLGIALRFAILPWSHPWDGRTFWNLFSDLALGINPYDRFVELTLEGRSRWHFGWVRWYEYYAYPPLLIYLYTPLAKLAALGVPFAASFPVPSAEPLEAAAFPLPFLLAWKLPIWLADVAVAVGLFHVTKRAWVAAMYFLNPLVLLVSGAWMFDAIPVALLLWAVIAYRADHVHSAAVLLALGALAKYFPLFVLPVFVMHLVWRRDWRVFTFPITFAAVAAALVWPFWEGVRTALEFNAARVGGGLTLHGAYLAFAKLQGIELLRFEFGVSPAIGAVTLLGGLTWAFLWLERTRPTLERGVLVTLLVVLLASKLVNEQYAVWVIPFLALEVAQRPSWVAHVAFHTLWVVPLAFAFVHVPGTAFTPALATATAWLLEQETLRQWAMLVLAVAFTAVLAASLVVFRPTKEVPA